MTEKDKSKAAGGQARAAALSAKERSDIAKNAAEKRWAIPQAQCAGILEFGEFQFPCAVLTDGTRVLTETDFMDAMGMYRSGALSVRRKLNKEGAQTPLYLAFKNLTPFINMHLSDVHELVLKYRTEQGYVANGIKAELIPKICDVWMDANEADVLGVRQKKIAAKAKFILRALANVGIIALVDEATGYQDQRARNALAKILETFIEKELQPWTRTFPETFYKEIFRLRGWSYKALAEGERPARPGVLGKYTNDLVYERLAPGIYEELQKINPKTETGLRKAHHHRWFTTEFGHPKLAAHIEAVTALARASKNWDDFKFMVNKAYPKPFTTMLLDI